MLPTMVAAQCPESEVANNLLSEDPIGHYTKSVLERTDEGINSAKALAGGELAFALFDIHFLSTIESIMYMLVDTDLRMVEYSRDLTSISTCLHLDLVMMEAKMEEVRCEINAAYDAKSTGALRQLKGVAGFLNARYKNLVKGALEPSHVDTGWVYYNEFDAPYEGWCCVLNDLECQIKQADDCTEVKNGAGGYQFFDKKDACSTESICVFAEDGETDPKYIDICPFDSDYLADNNSGYGCQLEVLEDYTNSRFKVIQTEVEALKALEEIRDEFLEDINHIEEVTQNLDQLVDNTMLNNEEREHLKKFGEVEDIEHRRVYGCNADVPPEDRDRQSDNDKTNEGFEGELTPEIKPSEEWGSIATRAPFFFRKDQLSIWKKFFRLQHNWASQRIFPGYLRDPDEFPEEDDRKEAVKRDSDAFGLLVVTRDDTRGVFSDFMHWQATQDSSILPKAQDAVLEVIAALKPVRPAMKNNIETVTDSGKGLRKFARNYAYFLRRTCIYRPCNEKLETIMKTLYSDECFPYASGDFDVKRNDDITGKSSWEKCQEAVKKL